MAFGQWAALRLLEKGFLCQPASQRWDVLRLEPPLTIAAEELEHAARAVEEVLKDYESLAPLAVDVAGRLGVQLLNGGSFR